MGAATTGDVGPRPHGGRRRRHRPAALTPDQVRWAAAQRQAGQPYKRICAALSVNRSTVRRAIFGLTSTYAGIVAGSSRRATMKTPMLPTTPAGAGSSVTS